MTRPAAVNFSKIAKQLHCSSAQVRQTLELLDAGNTVPFITRYRKDQTGGLDEEQIRLVQQEVTAMRALEERKQTVLRSIETQGKMTEELRREIQQSDNAKRLEDLYLPYRPKRQTRATIARERGLETLACEILAAAPSCEILDKRVADFVDPERDVPSAAEALAGAGHILAEQFSERADLRATVRSLIRHTGRLVSSRAKGADDNLAKGFRDYLDFQTSIRNIPPHRVLALNRGEKAKALKVRIEADHESMRREGEKLLVPADHPHSDFLKGCLADALERLLMPSLERETRRELSEKAESHAVRVFARNLKNLLLQPPVRERRVLAIDPGFKSGCKLVALDEFGNLLANDVIYLIGSEDRKKLGRVRLLEMVAEHRLSVIAIGNGTACRETEQLLADLLDEKLRECGVSYIVVNEAGASVYSASPLGREELPEHDATVRGAVSIGRRLQDPLSELVKIDPESIGVGLYQHDVKEKQLRDSLDAVVESCVNYVGVDLNSASPALLRYVSGLNQLTARRIYDYRVKNGPFQSRKELLEIPGFGEGAFVQSAGFLKIPSGPNPLDSTWIHPESYGVAEQILARIDARSGDLALVAERSELAGKLGTLDTESLAEELDVGRMSLIDMISSLSRPERDPREDLPPPIFRQDIVKLEDLSEGIKLNGTVLNVVDFGAFVDIGLSDSGLVHISQIANRFVQDPHAEVAVGDVVTVWVREVDKSRRRVSLTMIAPGSETPRTAPKQGKSGERRAKKTKPSEPIASKSKRRQRSAPPRKKRATPPAVPITDGMAQGSEPMRTFGDLHQFYDRKKSEETWRIKDGFPRTTPKSN